MVGAGRGFVVLVVAVAVAVLLCVLLSEGRGVEGVLAAENHGHLSKEEHVRKNPDHVPRVGVAPMEYVHSFLTWSWVMCMCVHHGFAHGRGDMCVCVCACVYVCAWWGVICVCWRMNLSSTVHACVFSVSKACALLVYELANSPTLITTDDAQNPSLEALSLPHGSPS